MRIDRGLGGGRILAFRDGWLVLSPLKLSEGGHRRLGLGIGKREKAFFFGRWIEGQQFVIFAAYFLRATREGEKLLYTRKYSL